MGDQRTRETRSPPKDKEDSLAYDCRNTYCENSKSSRKAIPLFKARSNRSGRRGATVAANLLICEDENEGLRRMALADHKSLHPNKRKSADEPLAQALAKRREREFERGNR